MKRKLSKVSTMLAATIILSIFLGSTLQASLNKESAAVSIASKTNASAQVSEKKVPSYLNATGYPIVKEPITLKFMVGRHTTQGVYSEIMAWTEYEKISGIKIDWIEVPQANVDEKRNLALASGDFPDAFYRSGTQDIDILKYGEEGVFINLNDYINDYAPNFVEVMEQMPAAKKSVPTYDGKIYSFPALQNSEAVQMGLKLWINSKWLDALDLEMPTTIDEFYTVLKAFKEQDPNGNGIADEIAFGGTRLDYLIESLKGSWGVMNRGKTHRYVDWDEKNNMLRFVPSAPETKEVLEFAHMLYNEGLIDQEIFTATTPKFTAQGEENLIGVFPYANTTAVGNTYAADYDAIPYALVGPHGDQLWVPMNSSVPYRGGMQITSANKYPEATVRWIDYFYGEEGQKLFFMGVEGETYKQNDDGSYEMLPEVMVIPTGSNYDQILGKISPFAGGNNPVLIQSKYFMGGETQPIPLKAAESLASFIPKEIWGPFSYSVEENEKLATLDSDIIGYARNMEAQFVQGKALFSEWDSFIAQLNKMGLEEYMEIYSAGYERYKSN